MRKVRDRDMSWSGQLTITILNWTTTLLYLFERPRRECICWGCIFGGLKSVKARSRILWLGCTVLLILASRRWPRKSMIWIFFSRIVVLTPGRTRSGCRWKGIPIVGRRNQWWRMRITAISSSISDRNRKSINTVLNSTKSTYSFIKVKHFSILFAAFQRQISIRNRLWKRMWIYCALCLETSIRPSHG